ncbi:MAG: TIGR04086 family membrane protein [Bacillota bacterium]|jgi:putative membrane protein (TIGR04086 family)|nr:TIGR04086 family membrane protein [Bacillota bacterium]NLD12896.1 TIGR04086 family membrane protein [Bacillota bacterium]HOB89364.1 TIGR04086 family membrane protein [Bacillota bacterium]HOJ58617.1 TIGR04086 family membrane protein [Bacillota bacterium]HOL02583.1 TIGR04086 family membrane protein [Bacillota bacterium]
MVLQRRGRPGSDRTRNQDKDRESARTSSAFTAIITGLITSIIAMVIIFLAIGVYGFYTSSDIASLGTLALSGSLLAIAYGGFNTGRKAGRRGLIYGGLVGAIFAIVAIMIGVKDSPSAVITLTSLKRVILSIVAGCIGGMVGVGLS